MSFDNWLEVAFGILFIITLILGVKWKQAKNLLKELAEALTATSVVVEDDDITAEERKVLLKEWVDVINSAKRLIGK
uniref:Holin n=1 Tax=viral metagenome TaxID=1070528 RepID=A0A6M3IQ98_9ZZZZ